MSQLVILHDRAKAFLRNNARWWAEHHSAEEAERWFEGFVTAIASLSETHESHAKAPEDPEFPFTVRELHYGTGSRPTHRALFTVRPDMVYVFLIRHLAQRRVTIDDATG